MLVSYSSYALTFIRVPCVIFSSSLLIVNGILESMSYLSLVFNSTLILSPVSTLNV